MTDGSAVVLMLRMVLSLAVVLGLVVAFARVLQRRQRGHRPRRARREASAIEVIARHNLSRTASVQIVQVGERALLLGVSDAGIRLLGRLPDACPQDDAAEEPVSDAMVAAASHADDGADDMPSGNVPPPALSPQTRAERRRATSPHPATQQATRAAARQADQVAQIIADALGRAGRRRG